MKLLSSGPVLFFSRVVHWYRY